MGAGGMKQTQLKIKTRTFLTFFISQHLTIQILEQIEKITCERKLYSHDLKTGTELYLQLNVANQKGANFSSLINLSIENLLNVKKKV